VEGAGIALAHGGWDGSIEVEGSALGKRLERWLESMVKVASWRAHGWPQ